MQIAHGLFHRNAQAGEFFHVCVPVPQDFVHVQVLPSVIGVCGTEAVRR